MRFESKSRRQGLSRLALATVAVAGLGLSRAAHAGLAFDNATAVIANGFAGDGTIGNPGGFLSSGLPDTYIGGAYNLPAGTTNITGFDLFPINGTDSLAANGYPVDGVNKTFTQIKATVYFWGTVNTGVVDASHPAFSNQLASGSVTFTADSDGYQPGYIYFFENFDSPGFLPGITFNSPVAITNKLVGVTINYQGSSDGVNFSNYQYLSNTIANGAAPTAGAPGLDGWYRNANNESNGNFTSTLRQQGSPYVFTSPMLRIFGDVAATNYTWNSSTGGNWEDTTKWNPNGTPTSSDTAAFNLSSAAGYTVNVNSSADGASTISVINDKVTFNLNTSSAQVTTTGALSVGVPTGSTAVNGSLSLTRGANQSSIGFVQVDSVNIGKVSTANGVGTLTIGNLIDVLSNNAVTLDAGSKLVIVPGGKLVATTLNLAGNTNAWTSRVDIGKSALDLPDADLNTVTNQVKQGLNAGGPAWAGTGGIISAAAAADTAHKTAVGVIQNYDNTNHQIYGSGFPLGLFDGENPGFSDVLVRYTYFGDSNLDGKVDGSDYSLLDNGFLNGLSGWFNGDYNYDGVIDGSDYTLIDNAFNRQFTLSSPSPIPAFGSDGSADLEAKLLRHEAGGLRLVSDDTLRATPTALVATTSAVPEPATAAVMCLLPLLVRRKRTAQTIAG